MTGRGIAALLALPALIAACSTGVPTAPAQDSCNAGAHAALIGRDKAAAEVLPAPKRIFQVGAPVTMDFLPERINVQYDTSGRIVSISCG